MLESLEAQRFQGAYEVLVIDNCSSDDTQSVANSFHALPIRYFFEPKQGLSHARNRALAEFVGTRLLFIDDDIRLEPGFLAAYADAFEAFPQAGYFGGRIIPDWPGAVPSWAQSKLSLIDGLLGWIDLGFDTRPFEQHESTPFGANFAISRTLMERIGVFDAELGCKGGRLGRGEETDWFLRARKAGGHGVYVGGALAHHWIDPERLHLRRLFDYGVESGAAHRLIIGNERRGSALRMAGFGLRGIGQLIKGRGDRFRQCIINMGIEYDALRH